MLYPNSPVHVSLLCLSLPISATTGPTGIPTSGVALVVSGTLSGGVPGHPHLSHHHHLRSLSQRNNVSTAATAPPYADSGASASASAVAPFSSHLRELETFRRKSTSTSSGNASNTHIDTPQSGGATGAAAGQAVSSEVVGGSSETSSARGGHYQQSNNHYNRNQSHHHQQLQQQHHQQQQQHLQANGYAHNHHHHHQEGAMHVDGSNSANNHLITGSGSSNDCQGYKPNAPHIQGEWKDHDQSVRLE